ncbi:MAG: hypothetical protein H6Q73_892 [Firmicutes bacterium]|nr:hypothetical protein [Bacillota bacterium]
MDRKCGECMHFDTDTYKGSKVKVAVCYQAESPIVAPDWVVEPSKVAVKVTKNNPACELFQKG